MSIFIAKTILRKRESFIIEEEILFIISLIYKFLVTNFLKKESTSKIFLTK